MRVTLNQAKLLYVSSLPSHPQAEGHNDLAAVNTSDSSDFGHLGRTSQATKKMMGRTSQHVSQLAFAGGGNILGDCSSCAQFALSLCIRISNSPILKSQQHDCYAAYTLHIHCICYFCPTNFNRPPMQRPIQLCHGLVLWCCACSQHRQKFFESKLLHGFW